MRIVSLLPSAAEMICALGLADRLVGRKAPRRGEEAAAVDGRDS
jgi:ABC-type hemin transport system substrate-binding protein